MLFTASIQFSMNVWHDCGHFKNTLACELGAAIPVKVYVDRHLAKVPVDMLVGAV